MNNTNDTSTDKDTKKERSYGSLKFDEYDSLLEWFFKGLIVKILIVGFVLALILLMIFATLGSLTSSNS